MLGYHTQNGLSFSAGGGSVTGGEITGDGTDARVLPGWLISVRLAWRWMDEDGAVPFVSNSVRLSFSRYRLEGRVGDLKMTGTDVRFGMTVGYTIADIWQLYLAPRFFGGPIFREENGEMIQGRDRYFFQAGLGTSLLLPGGFTFFVYVSPLGEQAVSAGAAFAF